MAESPLPSVFVSHGPPTLVLDDDPARDFLIRLGQELPRPKAILCASAHWLTETPAVTLSPRPETIHDFFGFDQALYDIGYPAPGDPELARRVAGLVEATGFACALDPERGLDHGAWEPLALMYPEADVPVVQLALVAGADAATHLRLGQALEPLRHEGVLVLASGTAVHNLAQWRADPATTPAWARAFDDWLAGARWRGATARPSPATCPARPTPPWPTPARIISCRYRSPWARAGGMAAGRMVAGRATAGGRCTGDFPTAACPWPPSPSAAERGRFVVTGTIRPGESDVLLVVDLQNDFCPGGALAVPEGDAILPAVNRLAGIFPHVVLTQDWHPPGHGSFASAQPGRQPFETIEVAYGPQTLWPDHCVQGTQGAAFHADLDTTKAELIIRKGFRRGIDSYSAFYENDRTTATGLSGYLRDRGFTRVFLVGLATDFCVGFSAADAAREGFQAVLIEDACRAIDLEGSLAAARGAMGNAGVAFAASDAVAA